MFAVVLQLIVKKVHACISFVRWDVTVCVWRWGTHFILYKHKCSNKTFPRSLRLWAARSGVRHEASLSPVKWRCGPAREGSRHARLRRFRGREVLPAGLKWHTGASPSSGSQCRAFVMTTAAQSFEALLPRPFYITCVLWKYTLEIVFKKSEMIPRISSTWTIKTPFSFIAKWMYEGSLRGTLPGSSRPKTSPLISIFYWTVSIPTFLAFNWRRCLREVVISISTVRGLSSVV